MRSSKQRQRNKQNRNTRPTGGNIVNRVFDSSGPDGKVRGTPQQIIEKYIQLHRDAQLSGDRVNAENFAQHAEHYTRMLAEAQREIDRARDEQDQWQRDRQAERDRQMEVTRERNGEPRGEQPRSEPFRGDQPRPDQPRDTQPREFQPRDGQPREGQPREGRNADPRADGQRDRDRERQSRFRVQEESAGGHQGDGGARFDAAASEDDGPGASFLRQPLFPVLVAEPEDDMATEGPALVETPEDRPREPRQGRPRRERRPDAPRLVDAPREAAAPEAAPAGAAPAGAASAEAVAAGTEEAPRAPRPRKPRRPRTDAAAPSDAAE